MKIIFPFFLLFASVLLEEQLLFTSSSNVEVLLRKITRTILYVSNLNEVTFYLDASNNTLTPTRLYLQSINEGLQSIFFIVNEHAKYFISLVNIYELMIYSIDTNEVRTYIDYAIDQQITMKQFDNEYIVYSTRGGMDYIFNITALNVETLIGVKSNWVDLSTNKVKSIINVLTDKTISYTIILQQSVNYTFQVYYYSFDGIAFNEMVNYSHNEVYPNINDMNFVQIDNTNVLIAFDYFFQNNPSIQCVTLNSYLSISRWYLTSSVNFTIPVSNQIVSMQVELLSSQLIIFAYLTEINEYKINLLYYISRDNYYFSSGKTINSGLVQGKFIVLTDYLFYFVKSVNNGTMYHYYGDLVSIAYNENKPPTINNHNAFYSNTTDINKCRNAKCLTCSKDTDIQKNGCTSCGVGFFTLLEPTTLDCMLDCPDGYFTLENDCLFLGSVSDNSTAIPQTELPKDSFIDAIENNVKDLAESSFLIQGNNYSIEVSVIDNTKETNGISYIFLGEQCESLLRTHYNLTKTEPLLISKIDEYNSSSITPIVEYRIYDSNGNILNNSICNSVQISYPILNDSSISLDKARNLLLNDGIDIYNIQSPFFNDLCFPYKENNNDIIIKDRINDIYKEVSFCSENCEYQGINYTTNKAICECGEGMSTPKYNKTNTKRSLFDQLIDATNIDLMKCYNVLLDKDKQQKNIGLYFSGTIFIIELVLLFIFIGFGGVSLLFKEVMSYKMDLYLIERTNSKEDINTEREHNLDECIYKDAVQYDNRNIFSFFFFLFLNKIELVQILFMRNSYNILCISLSLYLFSFLTDFTMNALLFSDDVISQKYHNNGSLSFTTTFLLTVISNILSYIVSSILGRLTNFPMVLELMIDNAKNKKHFFMKSRRLICIIKIKLYIYYVMLFIILIFCLYYNDVFCGVYSGSQRNWFMNSITSVGISLISSLGLCIIISVTRYIGIKCKSEKMYNFSLYLNK